MPSCLMRTTTRKTTAPPCPLRHGPPHEIFALRPPRVSPARFSSPPRRPCMSNSPTELHKHPSGCGQRWGSGGPERKAETDQDTAPDNSPSHPNLCRLSAPLPPYAYEPNGGGAG